MATSGTDNSTPEDRRRPAVDDRLVAPESRFEISDGKVVYVAPADEPHGTRHSKVAALVEAHARDDFDVAVDMLTRTSVLDDMAPDVSVFPRARDPETDGRQIEQIVFEICSTERLRDAGVKAAKLVGRGVRRVFVVDVERRRALEWSTATESWQILGPDEVITDSALAAPLPAAALVDAAKADDAVARALLVKGNPVLVSALRASHDTGAAEALVESVLAVLQARGLTVPNDVETRIRATRDAAVLQAWVREAATCGGADDLFE
ncbi:MAG: Uma2 family endonuclease [Myxococcales bacterium]|nr:Uma2 family endonuclease [Myxococcales bacterium]